MKATSIALAALIAISGTAFAGETTAPAKKKLVKPVQQSVQVDTVETGSIQSATRDKANKPRLGIDLNPFSFGTYH